MANEHFVDMPKAVWIIKIVQLFFSVLVLAFSAYGVSVIPVAASDLALFTSLFSILILVYYFVALHAAPQAYNWVALLALEALAVIFWLSSFAVLAAWYSALVNIANDPYDYCYPYCYKRDEEALSKRETYNPDAYSGLLIASLAFSVIQFILYCVTLGLMSMAIHRHRKAGNPMVAGMAPAAPRAQETEMKASPVNAAPPQQQTYYDSSQAQSTYQAQPDYQAHPSYQTPPTHQAQPSYQAYPHQQPTEMPQADNRYDGV